MNTADNTTDEGVDVVDMLIQLLVRQVSALVEETAHELAKSSGSDEATIYRALAENCATKAQMLELLRMLTHRGTAQMFDHPARKGPYARSTDRNIQ